MCPRLNNKVGPRANLTIAEAENERSHANLPGVNLPRQLALAEAAPPFVGRPSAFEDYGSV